MWRPEGEPLASLNNRETPKGWHRGDGWPCKGGAAQPLRRRFGERHAGPRHHQEFPGKAPRQSSPAKPLVACGSDKSTASYCIDRHTIPGQNKHTTPKPTVLPLSGVLPLRSMRSLLALHLLTEKPGCAGVIQGGVMLSFGME